MKRQLETSFGSKADSKTLPTENDRLIKKEGEDETTKLLPPVDTQAPVPEIAKLYSLNRRKAVVCLCAITLILEGVNTSLPGPFFPEEAEKKGLSQTQIGLVVGSFDLANLCFSFVIASVVSPKNIKFFYSCGMLWSAITVASFGILSEGPSGTVFFIMGIAIRATNGLGASMLYSTAMPIAAQMFPDKASLVTTVVQIAFGLGLLAGPPVGSLLLPLGGYKTPFLTVAVTEAIFFVLGLILVPSKGTKTRARVRNSDYIRYLFTPSTLSVLVPCAIIFSVAGIRDSAYALYYEEKLGMTPESIGYVFIASSVAFLIVGPIIGVLVELGMAAWVAVICHLSSSMFMFLSFLPSIVPRLETIPWALFILFGNGFTLASLMNPTFLTYEKVAIKQGHTNMQHIKTMVASSYNLTAASGRCIGSFLIGGFINDKVGFYNTCLYYAIALGVTSTWHLLFLLKNGWLTRIYYEKGQEVVTDKNQLDLSEINKKEESGKVPISELYLSGASRSLNAGAQSFKF